MAPTSGHAHDTETPAKQTQELSAAIQTAPTSQTTIPVISEPLHIYSKIFPNVPIIKAPTLNGSPCAEHSALLGFRAPGILNLKPSPATEP